MGMGCVSKRYNSRADYHVLKGNNPGGVRDCVDFYLTSKTDPLYISGLMGRVSVAILHNSFG